MRTFAFAFACCALLAYGRQVRDPEHSLAQALFALHHAVPSRQISRSQVASRASHVVLGGLPTKGLTTQQFMDSLLDGTVTEEEMQAFKDAPGGTAKRLAEMREQFEKDFEKKIASKDLPQ
jgi:hypothetical protein